MLKAIDLFCGAGGSSTGAAQAGVSIVAAVNHWKLAVETHQQNHPTTIHFCQDAALLDPRELPTYDILLASPECRGHTRARGAEQPHHDASRATAWCVVNVAEVTRPRAIVVENVPEMRNWLLYPQWKAALTQLGYQMVDHVLDAADFGVPQHRVRLFIVAMLDAAPPGVPDPASPHVPIGSVLDLETGNWSPVCGHAPNTLARIARARREIGSTFVMPYYGSGSGETGRSLDRPLGTVTTRDRWAIVHGSKMRMLTPDEYKRAMGFPAPYRLRGTRAGQIHLLGNAVCPPVMQAICARVIDGLGASRRPFAA